MYLLTDISDHPPMLLGRLLRVDLNAVKLQQKDTGNIFENTLFKKNEIIDETPCQ